MYFTALIPCHFYGSPKVTIGLLLEMNTGSFIPLLHFKSDHQISPLYCLVYQTLTSFCFVQSVLDPSIAVPSSMADSFCELFQIFGMPEPSVWPIKTLTKET